MGSGNDRAVRWGAVVWVGAICALLATLALPAAPAARAQAGGQTLYGLVGPNTLVRFSSSAPGTMLAEQTISGLATGEDLLGMDFRPATGQLFALGSTSQLYTIDTATGVATAVGAALTPSLNGNAFGMDFNPTVDRIRIVSDTDQNLRVNPNDGVAVVDGTLAYTTTDQFAGQNPSVTAAGYTNSVAGATSTQLFVLDTERDTLAQQNPANSGTLLTIGALGVDASQLNGFDIARSADTAFAALEVGGTSGLYTVNLQSGAATLLGAIGASGSVRALAVAPAQAEVVFALTDDNQLLRFRSNAPGTIIGSAALSGLAAGEQIQGIDFRPATGQLFALGSSQLYVVNPYSGAATVVGTAPLSPTLSGTAFGFDFNPTVDRIRIVSDADQNLRVNPANGAAIVDGTLAYTSTDQFAGQNPSVTAAGYTNSVAGATSTQLFVIDAERDTLAQQNPANSGTLLTIGALGVDSSSDIGFDISPLGVAYAALNVGGETRFGSINLRTGVFVPIGAFGAGLTIRGIAVPTNAVTPPSEELYGVTASNALVQFNSATPGTIVARVPISGLPSGATIQGIDFRPATGQLFALGSNSQLYTINRITGAATMVGTAPLSPTLSGTAFGMDFNPTVDRIRIVSDADQNLRVNPTNGAAIVDGTLAYTSTDQFAGQSPTIVAAGYTNNISGTTSTQLFVIDAERDTLALQNPANNGTLYTIGSLGVDSGMMTAFDITPRGGAFVALAAADGSGSTLGVVNLLTGQVSPIGAIGGDEALVALSAPTSALPRLYLPLVAQR